MIKKQYIPALALFIVATWLIYQRASTDSIKRDNIEREKMLRSSGNSSDDSRANARTKKAQAESSDAPVTSNAPIGTTRDWKYLVSIFCAEGKAGGAEKMAAWNRLKTLIAEMSEDELMAAHLEIKGLPTTPGRFFLEDAILKNLELSHPEYAFSQHIANFEKDDRNTLGLGRFHLWLARDPAAATAWYESEIAKGTFDKTLGDNYRLRQPFEAGFIRCLLASDPAAAESRMNQIPPEQRKDLVISYLEASENDPKALIDLIRKTISKEEQAMLVVVMAIDYNHLNDTAKVVESLSRINATQEERSTLLQTEAFKGAAFGKLDGNRMQQYREWALTIDPTFADRTAGLAFAEYAERYKNHDYITNLANNYYGLGAGDDFIIGFLEGSGSSRTPLPLDMAREFATKIKDQTRRNEILQKLK